MQHLIRNKISMAVSSDDAVVNIIRIGTEGTVVWFASLVFVLFFFLFCFCSALLRLLVRGIRKTVAHIHTENTKMSNTKTWSTEKSPGHTQKHQHNVYLVDVYVYVFMRFLHINATTYSLLLLLTVALLFSTSSSLIAKPSNVSHLIEKMDWQSKNTLILVFWSLTLNDHIIHVFCLYVYICIEYF